MRSSAFGARPRLPRVGIAPQLVIFVLVVGLAGAMAIEPTRQLLEQRERIEGMTEELRGIERSNQRLERRIARLNDADFIEQQARSQMGLVRPGETAVVVMPPSEKAKRRERRKPVAELPPPPAGFFASLLRFIGV